MHSRPPRGNVSSAERLTLFLNGGVFGNTRSCSDSSGSELIKLCRTRDGTGEAKMSSIASYGQCNYLSSTTTKSVIICLDVHDEATTSCMFLVLHSNLTTYLS